MVVSSDEALRDRMALYRNHGLQRKIHYWHELPGHNFRLTNIQAALGCAQVEQLDVIMEQRRRVYTAYKDRLQTFSGVVLQSFQRDVDAVVWAVTLRLDPLVYPQGRDVVLTQMYEAGIEVRPGFYTPSKLHFYDCPSLPVCEKLAASLISLPSFPTLKDEEIDRICSQLKILGRS